MAGEQHERLHFPDVAKLELDELIDQLVERAQGVKQAQGRLRALLHAIETFTTGLELDTLLHNIVEASCELAQARYGALGVLADDQVSLERFIYVGMDEATAARIGHLPEGKGLLGALINDPHPIRLQHISDDARSAGFPEHHPPMNTFLGVPILVRGAVFGRIYLANSAKGEFSAEDEQLLVAVGGAAGAAISNARLYEESRRLYEESRLQQRWLEASVEISTQMLSSTGEDPLQLIARRAIDIADADVVGVNLHTGEHLVIEVAYGPQTESLVGSRFPVDGTLGGEVLRTGAPILLANPSATEALPTAFTAVIDAGPVMALPLAGTGRPRGVLILIRAQGRAAFSPTDLAMANGFAAHASVALELADSRAAEQRLALLEDRDRIARDLHDHVIQELFAIGLSLEGSATQLDPQTKVGERIKRRAEDIDRTIRRIRTTIFQLRGNFVETERGLRQRVLEVASDLTPVLGFAPHVAFAGLVDLNLDPDLVEDVLACVREALTNVARHAQAGSAAIDVAMRAGELTVTVTDDGIGPAGAVRASGTANLRARAEKWNGSFEMAPAAGGGTMVTWRANIT